MNSLPPELHSLIFEQACNSLDGPQTVRAASLASTYFRTVAEPFLLHTLAVSSPEQAAHLIGLIEATPAPRRNIYRLYIGPGLGAHTGLALRLLHYAAPTLHDLAVDLTSCAVAFLGALFRTPLLHLKSLTVHGFYPLPSPAVLPALTHLHLVGNHSPARLPAALTRACPQITHLRISNLLGAVAFARELRDVVEGSQFPALQSVVLEGDKPTGQTSKVVEVRDGQMRRTFLALKDAMGRRERGPSVDWLEADPGAGDVGARKTAWLNSDFS
ncbi:hypothetical protein C8R46DRAFT_1095506 [Mycena filopes]|nr:hypothetical protein C8R46DRAFT_1095506 [Mycena filopes]